MKTTISKENTRMNIVISKELKKQAEKQAQNEMRSVSNLISVAIKEYIEKNNKRG